MLSYASLSEVWQTPASLKKSQYRPKREVENSQVMKMGPVAPQQNQQINLGNGPQTSSISNLTGSRNGSIYSLDAPAASQQNVEHFSNAATMGPIGVMVAPTYAARAPDYKYGCSAYNICPSPGVEGFEDQQANVERQQPSTQLSCQNIATQQPYVSPYNGNGQQACGQANPSAPNQVQSQPPVPGQPNLTTYASCGTADLPIYDPYINSQANKSYDSALNASLTQAQPTNSYSFPPNYKNPVDMSKVGGFYDEEIESYLHSIAPLQKYMSVEQEAQGGQNITTLPYPNNNPTTLQPSLPAQDNSLTGIDTVKGVTATANICNATTSQSAVGPSDQQQIDALQTTLDGIYKNMSQMDVYNEKQKWWDLLIYILAGVLIIILLEQLFRIAVTIGVRRTILQLEPYLNINHGPGSSVTLIE